MKLKEHIQLVNYNNKAILVNTYNKSIVTINSDRICNKEILKDIKEK